MKRAENKTTDSYERPDLTADEEIRAFKPKLRFVIGDIVFLKNDPEKKIPMMIVGYAYFDDSKIDYHVFWINSQRTAEHMEVHENVLFQ